MSASQTINGRLVLKNAMQIKGERIVLDRISIDLNPGEVIALLGPNGAGKSSLLEIIAGLRIPSSGEVQLGDAGIHLLPRLQRAKRLGFLPQRAEIAWPLDVETFVSLGRLPFQQGFVSHRTQVDQDAIENAMTATNVEMLRNRLINTLSGGELSRVSLARVLAGEPEWLLLDEPMTGLDPGHQFALSHLLRKLASEGKGIIVTLHDLSLAAHLADRVLLLHKGALIADGTPSHVFTASRIKEVYGVNCTLHHSSNGLYLSLTGLNN